MFDTSSVVLWAADLNTTVRIMLGKIPKCYTFTVFLGVYFLTLYFDYLTLKEVAQLEKKTIYTPVNILQDR